MLVAGLVMFELDTDGFAFNLTAGKVARFVAEMLDGRVGLDRLGGIDAPKANACVGVLPVGYVDIDCIAIYYANHRKRLAVIFCEIVNWGTTENAPAVGEEYRNNSCGENRSKRTPAQSVSHASLRGRELGGSFVFASDV